MCNETYMCRFLTTYTAVCRRALCSFSVKSATFSLMVISFSFCFHNPLKQFFKHILWKHRISKVILTVVHCSFQSLGSSEFQIWWNLDHIISLWELKFFAFTDTTAAEFILSITSLATIKSLTTIFISIHLSQNHLRRHLSKYHAWSSKRDAFIVEDRRYRCPNSSATHSSVGDWLWLRAAAFLVKKIGSLHAWSKCTEVYGAAQRG